MTTPHVTELPRRLEPISSDTFLGAREDDAPPSLAAARDARPLADVLQLRPRDPLAARRPRPPKARRRMRPPWPGAGPGGDAA